MEMSTFVGKEVSGLKSLRAAKTSYSVGADSAGYSQFITAIAKRRLLQNRSLSMLKTNLGSGNELVTRKRV